VSLLAEKPAPGEATEELLLRDLRTGRAYPLGHRKILGRTKGDLHLPEYDRISAEHCLLERRDGHVVLRDLGSKNGTKVNGIYLDPKDARQLAPGDVIGLGGARLRLEAVGQRRAAPEFTLHKAHAVEFRGKTSEFFSMWIVNITLSVLTLGAYSAWAKVRTRRYFLGNTYVGGANFDFHANPWRILKGRALMTVVFAAYVLGPQLSAWIRLGAILVAALAFPLIVIRATAFNLGSTSYRNIRFGFRAETLQSYRTYFEALLVTLGTAGLAFPWAMFKHFAFRVNHAFYGRTPFRFEGGGSSFFGIYFVASLQYVGLNFLTYFLKVGLEFAITSPRWVPALHLFTGLFPYAAFLLFTAHVRAHAFNFVANRTQLGPLKLAARMGTKDLFLIYLTNVLACVGTLGLLVPWAMVRTAKYRLGCIEVHGALGSFEDFESVEGAAVAALGDAASDFLDLDLGY
jgi:uncharacterized membrane protein YjgN (DUF898 family)